ncbi:MAG: NTP transferase domain-containing protein [Streptosporangiales bacterium]|nr:NTP transferase domain-containing protein [Streptosporangiales bacterium]
MAGPDKVLQDVGGRRLLDRVLDACAEASRVVVVGPETDVPRPVHWAREDPPGGGPVAAVRTGLAEVRGERVALLAGDLPFLRPADLRLLYALAHPPASGAVLVDDAGREQWLTSMWRVDALTGALRSYSGDSLRGLLAPLRPRPLGVMSREPRPWLDCDTPEQLDRARRLAPDPARPG